MSEYLSNLRKYNYWDGEPIKAGFRREGYLRKIQGFSGNSLVRIWDNKSKTASVDGAVTSFIRHPLKLGIPLK